MTAVENAKNKVQRILTNEFGSARIDRDGDFVIDYESAVIYISVTEGFGDDGVIIRTRCPMVCDAPITPDLTRWVAIDGQRFRIGGVMLNPNEDGTTAWIYFRHHIIGDDLDESELLGTLYAVTYTSNDLDEELQSKFGGTLYRQS